MPLRFCALAGSAAAKAESSAPAAMIKCCSRLIFLSLSPAPGRLHLASPPGAESITPTRGTQGHCPTGVLFVEPDVFHAPAVKDAVDHDRQPLDIGLPAGPAFCIENDWPGAVFGELSFNVK